MRRIIRRTVAAIGPGSVLKWITATAATIYPRSRPNRMSKTETETCRRIKKAVFMVVRGWGYCTIFDDKSAIVNRQERWMVVGCVFL